MTHIQLLRCGLRGDLRGSGPAAPSLFQRLCWSVSSVREITDQESDFLWARDAKRRLENRSSNRRADSVENSSVISGLTRASSILVGCDSEQVSVPLWCSTEGGGDEETRTPDPLLA